MAKEVKTAGFKLMLDFHYSDTWTDPGKHSTPASWTGDAAQLANAVYTYTKESLKKLKDAGVTPDFIQPGNEITYGMMWPTAHIWPGGGGQDGGTWDNFTSYLKNAIKACKEYGYNKLAIAGGVASNSGLRELMEKECKANKIQFYRPSPVLCTDNAAMIAITGLFKYYDKDFCPMEAPAYSRVAI